MPTLLQVGAAWHHSKGDGLSISLQTELASVREVMQDCDGRLTLFPNKWKKSEKQPDFRVFIDSDFDEKQRAVWQVTVKQERIELQRMKEAEREGKDVESAARGDDSTEEEPF